MKYKTKIVPQDGGYVGYVILDESVVFSSNLHKDTVMVARELSSYIADTTQSIPAPAPIQKQSITNPAPSPNNIVPVLRTGTNPAAIPVRTTSVSNSPAPRRCCGR